MPKFSAYATAGFVFAATLIAYATMLSANVAFGDEAEAQTVPYILGIAHPTGFPAYTLAGWLFSHALPFGTVAWRLNLFTAACTALTVAGVYLLAVTLAENVAVAVLAALIYAFGFTAWNTALHANAQSPATPLEIFALYGCLVFARNGSARALVAACACCGLGIADHPFAVWTVPAIPAAMAWQYKRLTLPLLGAAAAALVLPLLLYGYFPLRSAYVVAYGLDPSAGPPLFGAGSFDIDPNAPHTKAGFMNEVLGRREVGKVNLAAVVTRFSFADTSRWWYAFALKQYDLWLLVLAALGTLVLLVRDRRALTVLAAGTLGGAYFAHLYRNDDHIDRYTLVMFAIIAVLAAASANAGLPRRAAIVLRSLVALLLVIEAGVAVVGNHAALAAIPPPNGQLVIDAAQRQTPGNAIIVAQWNDAAALGYGAFVEDVLGSRLLVAAWAGEYAQHYRAWAASRPVLGEHSFGPFGYSFQSMFMAAPR